MTKKQDMVSSHSQTRARQVKRKKHRGTMFKHVACSFDQCNLDTRPFAWRKTVVFLKMASNHLVP